MLETDIQVLDNLRLVDQLIEAFNKHDLDQFMDFYDESALYYAPTQAEPLKGRDAIRVGFESFFSAFPDVKIEKIRAFGQDDWSCTEVILTGTHTGPLMSPNNETIPATNKPIRVPMCLVINVKDGKMIELRDYNDQRGFLAQLGLQ
ncbi:MAG: ester cyclase [Candidatus Thorarchaeota archaeon]